MKRGIYLYRLILAACLLIIIACAAGIGINRHTRARQDENAPGFLITKPDGGQLSNKDLLGHSFCLLFIRADCNYCLEELKQLNTIYTDYKDKFDLLLVSTGNEELSDEFKARLKMPLDLYRASPEMSSHFKVKNVPMLVLVDEHGKIRYRQMGLRSEKFQKIVFERFVRRESLTDEALRLVYKTQ